MNPFFFLIYGSLPLGTGNHSYLYGQSSSGVDRYVHTLFLFIHIAAVEIITLRVS